MIPQNNSTDQQQLVLQKIKHVEEHNAEISDKLLMITIFHNYRTGGGLRLSKFAYDICKKNSLYEFYEVPFPRDHQNSIVYTSLDRICSSPYYVEGNKLFLSDGFVLAQFTFCNDNFKKLFKSFM